MPLASVIAFLLILSQVASPKHFRYNPKLGVLFSRKKKGDFVFDETPFIVGVVTLLKQVVGSFSLSYFFFFPISVVACFLEIKQKLIKPVSQHSAHTHTLFAYLGQYVRAQINASLTDKDIQPVEFI